jgi:hypothetical protein
VARRRQGDVWICYMPQLLTEIRVPPAVLGAADELQVGSEIPVLVGLNYRGLLPWDRRTEGQRPVRAKEPRSTHGPDHAEPPPRAVPARPSAVQPSAVRPSPALMPPRRPHER